MPLFYNSEKNEGMEAFEKEIIAFENSIVDTTSKTSKQADTVSYFQFNPNLLSDSGWYELGFNTNQVNLIRKYLENGGRFESPDDLKKLYCLAPGQYDALETYINIPPAENKSKPLFREFNNRPVKLHDFDPNCTTAEEWNELGLSAKQVKVVENYISKGGKFRSKEDLKKLYCIPPVLYDQLEPYISIVTAREQQYDPEIRIDINLADSATFRKIKFITPFLARNIVKYRKALGGFVTKIQIREVWGMKSDTYNNIEKNIYISGKQLKTLDMNSVGFSDLLKHPYLNYELTKSIVQYRKVMGRINSFRELSADHILPDSVISKISPYFFFE